MLLEIRDANGGTLTPEVVVDAAREPDHPLHSRFEWDDSVAAEKYRRDQAHQIIQKAKISYQPHGEDGPPRLVRAFHAVRAGDGHVYEPTEKVVEDPFTQRLVLADMERRWKELYEQFKEFSEFLDMVRRDLGDAA